MDGLRKAGLGNRPTEGASAQAGFCARISQVFDGGGRGLPVARVNRHSQKGPSMSQKSIAVIGAGITGVTTAYALTQRGYAVTVFDRQRYPAMETSFANGGQLSASNAEVWNQWSNVRKGLRWLLRKDAPLKFNLRPSLSKYRWMAAFMTEIPNYAENTQETIRLAMRSRAFMFEMAEREQIPFDLQKRGILHIYMSPKDLAHARRVNAMYGAAGLERREVGVDEISAIEPTLRGGFIGGFYTESDSTGDIHKFTRGLADAFVRQGGVFRGETACKVGVVNAGVEVTPQPIGGGAEDARLFDAVVICAGVESPDLAAQLGDRLPIYPVKGYSITVELEDQRSQDGAPWVSLLDDDAKIVTSRLGDDRLRVAGTAEFAGHNRDIRDYRIRPLTQWVRRFFPDVQTDKVIPWAGLRPMMPNMMPRVAPGAQPGVFYNTGHGHLGWTLSAVTANMIGDAVKEQIS